MQPRPRRKNIRLPRDAYEEFGLVWHVTVAVKDRNSQPFAEGELASAISEMIESRAHARQTPLLLYCLMPDHLHLLVQINTVSLGDVIGDIKSNTTRVWWTFGGHGQLWQRSYYDHGIRGQSDGDQTIAYIIDNPIRKGLCQMWEEYPYLGGLLIQEDPAYPLRSDLC